MDKRSSPYFVNPAFDVAFVGGISCATFLLFRQCAPSGHSERAAAILLTGRYLPPPELLPASTYVGAIAFNAHSAKRIVLHCRKLENRRIVAYRVLTLDVMPGG